jgi:nucleotidyltransferase substrate binding protein (TIGR01987 family)
MGLFYMKKFDQYVRHLQVFCRAEQEDVTNEFIVSGIIDKFYIQFELGGKVLKELLRYEGANQAATGSPREIIKTAYAYFHFMEEDVWLEMLRDRNDATHIYNEEAAQQLVEKILHQYIGVFVSLEQQIRARYGDEVLEQL